MEYGRTVTLDAGIETVWSLIDDLEAVAMCIPGISDFALQTPTSFTCLMTQKVGHVTSRLALTNELKEIEPMKRVTVLSAGDDKRLRASVKCDQTFELAEKGGQTEVAIQASIHVTGRIAMFGGRIILAKAEQVVVEGLANVERLLRERSPSAGGEDSAGAGGQGSALDEDPQLGGRR